MIDFDVGGCRSSQRVIVSYAAAAEETRSELVAVTSQPVLSVVYRYQVLDQFFVRFADVAVFAFLRAEHDVVVQRIVDDREP